MTVILAILFLCLWVGFLALIVYNVVTLSLSITKNKFTLKFIKKKIFLLLLYTLAFCCGFLFLDLFTTFLVALILISLTEVSIFLIFLFYYYNISNSFSKKRSLHTTIDFDTWKELFESTPDNFVINHENIVYNIVYSCYKTFSCDTVYFVFNTVVDFLKFILYINEVQVENLNNKEQKAMDLIKQTVETYQKH